MNIVLVPKADKGAASSRTRIHNHIPYLQNINNVTVSQVTYPHAEFLESLNGAIRHTVRSLGRAPIRLFRIMALARTADIVYVQRVLSPQLMRLLSRTDATLVYDIDDAIYLNDSIPDQYHETVTDYLNPCLQMADAVCVASPPLANYAHQFCDNIYHLHSPVDVERFTPVGKLKDETLPLRLGWVGNAPDHIPHLKLLVEVLGTADFQSTIELRIVGTRGDTTVESLFDDLDFPVDLVEWVDPDDVVQELQMFDIALMPLQDTAFARAKCPVKTLEYMAVGLPIVASSVGMNTEFIVDGDSGRLAATVEEWEMSINTLLQSHEIRNEIGSKARNRVVNNYSQQVANESLVRMFREVSSSY